MTKPTKNDRRIEEQLANFTDNILDSRNDEDQEPAELDPELFALQQTALRLKNALSPEGPSEEVIHRMRHNIVMQWREQKEKERGSFWHRFLTTRVSSGRVWQSQYMRQRQSQRVFFAAAILLLLLSVFVLDKFSSVQPAASGQNLNAGIFFACAGLILLTLWLFRRGR